MATKTSTSQAPAKKKYSALADVFDFVGTFVIPFDDVRYFLKSSKKGKDAKKK